jgi:hypothetical protein
MGNAGEWGDKHPILLELGGVSWRILARGNYTAKLTP